MAFEKGNKLGGRKKGRQPLDIGRTLLHLVPKVVKRLQALMDDERGDVSFKACKEVLDRVYGKATESLVMTGTMAIVVNIGEKKAPTES